MRHCIKIELDIISGKTDKLCSWITEVCFSFSFEVFITFVICWATHIFAVLFVSDLHQDLNYCNFKQLKFIIGIRCVVIISNIR